MKRIYNISIALAAVLLASVSCQKVESAPASAGGDTDIVTFDFSMDDSLTKADGNVSPFGTGVLNGNHELVWQLYVDDDTYSESEPVQTGVLTATTEGTLGPLDIPLAMDKNYRILFFLRNTQAAEDSYDFSDLRKVSLNYSVHNASDDSYDIFCASADVDPLLDKSVSVTLKRPTAQINVADKVADWATANGYDRITLSVAEAGTVLDVATGKAVGKGAVSYASSEIIELDFDETSGYKLHSMVYVLPSENASDITLEFSDDESSASLVVEQVELTPNTRLNVLADDLIATIPSENKMVTRIVTSENLNNTVFDQNGVYKFEGTFDGNIRVNASVGITAVFDGKDATFNGQIHVSQGIADHPSDVNGTRSGKYTVRNFNAQVVSVSGIATTLNVLDNTAEAIDVDGTNAIVNVSGNVVDSKGVAHIRTDGSVENKYGIYLYMVNYELTLDNNTVTGSLGHAIGINGKSTTDFGRAEAKNVIGSFVGNTMTVGQYEADRAGFKIWDDVTYAPKSNATNDVAKAFVENYKGLNTFIKGEKEPAWKFNIYDDKLEQIN